MMTARDEHELFVLADRLAMLCHHMPRCAACGDAQVQVVDYFHVPALWKCRVCKHRFSFEPGPERNI